jgi:hypothetical protein
MEVLLDRGHAAVQDLQIGLGHRTANDRPQSAEPDRLGFGTFGERDDILGLPVGSSGQPADCAIHSAPAAGLGGGLDFGLAGPTVGRASRHLVIARPQGHRSALRDRDSELDFRLLAELSRHGVGWHAATIGPTAGTRLPRNYQRPRNTPNKGKKPEQRPGAAAREIHASDPSSIRTTRPGPAGGIPY